MDKKRPNLFWGIALILIGGFFLAMNVGLIPQLTENVWSMVFAVISVLFFIGLFTGGVKNWGLLFPAVISGAIALTIGLATADADGTVIGGLFMLAISLPFWIGYFINRREHWGLLIPAWIMAAIGIVILMAGGRSDQWIGAFILYSVGLPFVVVYLTNRQHWWALIPAYVMAVLGTIVLLSDTIQGEWIGALFMFAVALPFLVVFLADRENWWALIPAGITATIGVIVLLTTIDLSEPAEVRLLGGGLFLGIGLTFALIWSRGRYNGTDWAKYPAAGFFLAALAVIIFGPLVEDIWSIIVSVALIGSGIWMLYRSPRPQEKLK